MQSQERKPSLLFNPQKALYLFGGLWIIVLIFSLLGQYLRMFPDNYSIHSATQGLLLGDFTKEFDVNSEANITTYYSVSMAIISSLLLFTVAYFKMQEKDKYRFHWAILGAFLLYISMDDASVIHEKFSRYLKGWTVLGGWFEYKWVILGIAVVVILGITFFRFWLQLDTKYKILFLVSAGLFFGGAVGFEVLGGRWAYSFGSKNFTYVLFTTFEQGLQYSGLTTLVYTLLTYLRTYFPHFSISVKSSMEGK